VIKNRFVPILCGAALRNKGIQPLLQAVCDFLPAPSELPPVKGKDPRTGDYEERLASAQAPFCALCFKVAADPYVGRLNYLRVYSGSLSTGETVYNATQRTKEKTTKLLLMHANHQEIIPEASTGNIVAVVGLKETRTGDTLCEEDSPILLESIRFPEPVISQAIEPKSNAEEDRLFGALRKLADEDPSFRVAYNEETGQMIVSGMGQLHLEVAVDRILREFNVQARVGRPQVAYKETVTKKVVSSAKFLQSAGGKPQFAHVVLEVAPSEQPNSGVTFYSRLKTGVIPREFAQAAQEGVLMAAKSGIVAGYPVTDVVASLVDGSYQELESNELAFQTAGAMAFNDALRKAHSVLLEPIMEMEIVCPEEYMGSVISDLTARRGKVLSLAQRSNIRLIRTNVPLSEVFDYATILRTLTQGRASYAMEPSFYQEVPSDIAVKVIGRLV
jgi:elongation factor G